MGKETPAEAETLAQQRLGGDLEKGVLLEVVLLRRDIDETPMCIEYAFREGCMVHASEMYTSESGEIKSMPLPPGTDVPMVCSCCTGAGVVIATGVCPLCDGSKAFI